MIWACIVLRKLTFIFRSFSFTDIDYFPVIWFVKKKNEKQKNKDREKEKNEEDANMNKERKEERKEWNINNEKERKGNV